MFDTVWFDCPKCGQRTVDAQSKAGECVLADIDGSAVPLAIAADIEGQTVYCRDRWVSYPEVKLTGCGASFTVCSLLQVKSLPMFLR